MDDVTIMMRVELSDRRVTRHMSAAPPLGPYLMSHVTQPVKLSPPVTQSLGDRERVTVVTEKYS